MTVQSAVYVALNGNDSNPGTLAEPLKTVTKAVSLAQPGTVIYLRGDITTEGVTKTASFEGDAANGVLSCLTETGDIDVLGTWRGQAYYELGSFKGHTQPAEIFYVEENLD